jgi:hypothetical protein
MIFDLRWLKFEVNSWRRGGASFKNKIHHSSLNLIVIDPPLDRIYVMRA